MEKKTRHDNRHLYVQGVERAWTPIKPVTAQFAVGRNRTQQYLTFMTKDSAE